MMGWNRLWHCCQLQAIPKSHSIFLDSNMGVIEWIRAQQKGFSGHFLAFLHSHKDWKVLLFLKTTYPPPCDSSNRCFKRKRKLLVLRRGTKIVAVH